MAMSTPWRCPESSAIPGGGRSHPGRGNGSRFSSGGNGTDGQGRTQEG